MSASETSIYKNKMIVKLFVLLVLLVGIKIYSMTEDVVSWLFVSYLLVNSEEKGI